MPADRYYFLKCTTSAALHSIMSSAQLTQWSFKDESQEMTTTRSKYFRITETTSFIESDLRSIFRGFQETGRTVEE